MTILASPERHAPLATLTRKHIIHQLRYGSMQLAHEFAQLHANLEIPHEVVMVIHQRCDPRRELVSSRVILKSIPEHRLGWLACKRRMTTPASRGDEVDLIVAIPMLERIRPRPRKMLAVPT